MPTVNDWIVRTGINIACDSSTSAPTTAKNWKVDKTLLINVAKTTTTSMVYCIQGDAGLRLQQQQCAVSLQSVLLFNQSGVPCEITVSMGVCSRDKSDMSALSIPAACRQYHEREMSNGRNN